MLSLLKTGTLQKNEPYQTNVFHILLEVQAHSQVLGFGGSKYILEGARLLFLYVITIFLGAIQFDGVQKYLGVTFPECPRGYGPFGVCSYFR